MPLRAAGRASGYPARTSTIVRVPGVVDTTRSVDQRLRIAPSSSVSDCPLELGAVG
jgi:hypothetical protein